MLHPSFEICFAISVWLALLYTQRDDIVLIWRTLRYVLQRLLLEGRLTPQWVDQFMEVEAQKHLTYDGLSLFRLDLVYPGGKVCVVLGNKHEILARITMGNREQELAHETSRQYTEAPH